jgi:hypothetical protein
MLHNYIISSIIPENNTPFRPAVTEELHHPLSRARLKLQCNATAVHCIQLCGVFQLELAHCSSAKISYTVPCVLLA